MFKKSVFFCWCFLSGFFANANFALDLSETQDKLVGLRWTWHEGYSLAAYQALLHDKSELRVYQGVKIGFQRESVQIGFAVKQSAYYPKDVFREIDVLYTFQLQWSQLGVGVAVYEDAYLPNTDFTPHYQKYWLVGPKVSVLIPF